MKIDIVWIEVGRPVPNYAKNNFRLTSKLHSEVNQHLVTDSKSNIQSSKNFNVLLKDHLIKSDETKEFEKSQKNWDYKQEYFWKNTTARFFYLFDFMFTFDLSKILHLETDCLLLCPSAFVPVLDNSEVSLAFPMQANSVGCASVMYVREGESLRKFLHFVLDNWHRSNITDMELLGEFSQSEGVAKLPTDPWVMKGDAQFIFDAGSVGRYFLGTDARNCRIPFSSRGKIDSREGSIGPKLANGLLDFNSNLNMSAIVVEVEGIKTKLANIHIHSKNISSTILGMNVRLHRGFNRRNRIFWRIGRFDRYVFMERARSFALRRFWKTTIDTERPLR